MPAHTGKIVIMIVEVLVSKVVSTVAMEQHIISGCEAVQFCWQGSNAATVAAPNT